MFRKGIEPKWEDPAHKQGGAWVFKARKQHANIIWENLLLGLIGEQFELANEVTGVLVHSAVQDINKFQVWFRHGRNDEVIQKVRQDFLKIIDLSPETQVSYTAFNSDSAAPALPEKQAPAVSAEEKKDDSKQPERVLQKYAGKTLSRD